MLHHDMLVWQHVQSYPRYLCTDSCWVSFLSLHETSVMILITVKLLNSIIMSTRLKYNFTLMFSPVLQKTLVSYNIYYNTHNNYVSHFILEKHRFMFPFIVWIEDDRITQPLWIWKRYPHDFKQNCQWVAALFSQEITSMISLALP